MKKFEFLKVLNSPLKPFKLTFYLGKIRIGTPYFYPRKTVKNKEKPGYLKFKSIKWFGINIVSLGWKTKWTNTDYRFEWSPMISIVFCKLQFCVFFIAPEKDQYWEVWLYYHYNTDKTKSKKERIEQAHREFPQVWTNTKEGEVDYYNKILRKKYLPLSYEGDNTK